jgi:hypothetical protein
VGRTQRGERRVAEGGVDAAPQKERGLQRLKRKAGCILGLFTEPLVLLGVTLLAVVFGRAYLSRRAERLRARQSEDQDDD